MNQMFTKAKALKKVIRFGNLNSRHRASYWRHITDQKLTVEQVRDLANLKETDAEK